MVRIRPSIAGIQAGCGDRRRRDEQEEQEPANQPSGVRDPHRRSAPVLLRLNREK